MMTYTEFLQVLVAYLEIRKPVILRVLVGETDHLENDGEQWGKKGRWYISATEGGTRCVWSIIAHELIHCYMDEHHPRAQFHGRKFRQAAKMTQEFMERRGVVFDDPIFMIGDDAND
jgi:hypothetical protein